MEPHRGKPESRPRPEEKGEPGDCGLHQCAAGPVQLLMEKPRRRSACAWGS